uniref:Uncharacterized protein n=1 Tax=Anopheles atroparvus TaxID=41427 RepID=A0A182JFR7_ANOAO
MTRETEEDDDDDGVNREREQMELFRVVMPLTGRFGLYSTNRLSFRLSTSSSVSISYVFFRRPTRCFGFSASEAVSLLPAAEWNDVTCGRIDRLNFQWAGPAQNWEMLSSGR